MGLSRNKVAVSEGAAGSPPFYGESEKALRSWLVFLQEPKRSRKSFSLVVQFPRIISENKSQWGRSSLGRALEWHSRGREFDPLRLHHAKNGLTMRLSRFFILHKKAQKRSKKHFVSTFVSTPMSNLLRLELSYCLKSPVLK